MEKLIALKGWSSMKSLVKINIHGVNIAKLYKILKKNNIAMFDICRKDYKTLIFTTYCTNQKKLIALLNNSCYTINVEEYYGPKKWLNFFTKRLGYVVGAIFFAVVMICSNFFVTDIKIYGLSTLTQQNITQFLNQNGVHKGAFISRVNAEQISASLSNNFEQISLVSVIKKGTSIIINIKEKQSVTKLEESFANLVATKSGTVLEIETMEGTPLVKVGDSFKTGDVLIQGSFKDIYGNDVSCHAQGKITAQVNYTVELDFENQLTIYKRTGKVITNSKYWLFGWNLKTTSHQNTFEFFEQEQYTETLFKNNFLPIKAEYTKFYETKPSVVTQNFDEQKNKLIEQAKLQAHQMVNNIEIVNEFENILETQTGYKVIYTIQTIEQL